MLILKNLTESSGILYERFIGSPFFLSPSLLSSLPQFTSERAFKFRKSGEIYSGTDCLFYPIPRIRVRSDHLRSFHLQGNFILGFRISSIFSASIRFFFLFFSRPTTRCRFHPALCAALRETAWFIRHLKSSDLSQDFCLIATAT